MASSEIATRHLAGDQLLMKVQRNQQGFPFENIIIVYKLTS
jgi:hypothetical protein